MIFWFRSLIVHGTLLNHSLPDATSKSAYLKSKIIEKYPSSPINSSNSSYGTPGASATVIQSCFLNVFSFNSFKNSPIPGWFLAAFVHFASPSTPSASLSFHVKSFLMNVIASIRNPAIPFSSHQLTISYNSFLTSSFSQFRSGCFLWNT